LKRSSLVSSRSTPLSPPPISFLLTPTRITEGQFYEAQQQTRVVAARYIKAKDWASAIDILSNVASSLLKADQGGSGGDLSIFLVDVYKQAELVPDAANRGKLLTLLRLFDPEEPTRKKFISEMIGYVPLPSPSSAPLSHIATRDWTS